MAKLPMVALNLSQSAEAPGAFRPRAQSDQRKPSQIERQPKNRSTEGDFSGYPGIARFLPDFPLPRHPPRPGPLYHPSVEPTCAHHRALISARPVYSPGDSEWRSDC
jgi:hypothetical protein